MARKKLTLSEYESYLNDQYSEQDNETVKDHLIYLTNKSRGKHCTATRLENAIYDSKAGTLLRSLDPIAFTVGFNDHNS